MVSNPQSYKLLPQESLMSSPLINLAFPFKVLMKSFEQKLTSQVDNREVLLLFEEISRVPKISVIEVIQSFIYSRNPSKMNYIFIYCLFQMDYEFLMYSLSRNGVEGEVSTLKIRHKNVSNSCKMCSIFYTSSRQYTVGVQIPTIHEIKR